MLDRPNWLREYPDLWEALPAIEAGIRTDTARDALQRILDVKGMGALLRPTLPAGHNARSVRWVCDLLRSAAYSVDNDYGQWERERKARLGGTIAFTAQQRKRAKQQPQFRVPLLVSARRAEQDQSLFGGPPPFERPGPDLPARRAALMLCGLAQRPLQLKDPDLFRLVAALLIAVFYPTERAGDARGRSIALRKRAEWVRGIIRAERGRLRK